MLYFIIPAIIFSAILERWGKEEDNNTKSN